MCLYVLELMYFGVYIEYAVCVYILVYKYIYIGVCVCVCVCVCEDCVTCACMY